MIYLYGLTVGSIALLWVISKIIISNTVPVEHSYSKPFLATAVLVHRLGSRIPYRAGGSRLFNFKNTNKIKLAGKLQTINPGESADAQLYRYSVERTSTMILILFIGSLFAMIVSITAVKNRVLSEGDTIYRNAYGEADIAVNLTAGIQNENLGDTELEIIVPARAYTYDEATSLFEMMESQIDPLLLGNNDRADHVIYSLNLLSSVDGYPFDINWESDNYEYLYTDGKVNNDALTEPVTIELKADCKYESWHWYFFRTVTICPPEPDLPELIYQEILEQIALSNKRTITKEYLVLPESISYGRIDWEERIDDSSALILFFALCVCVLIVPISEAEIDKKIKKRKRELLIEYPAFVSKLTLYIGAGMSVRNCFLRMGHEYEKTLKRGGKCSALGMELAITAHEIETGISEIEAYEHLAKRCAGREYMRFVALLTQNMKKGSTDLINLLKKEAADAFEIRKNEARKLGEEASTKLLLPMIMMLAIVMVIIMVPAYMSFSS